MEETGRYLPAKSMKKNTKNHVKIDTTFFKLKELASSDKDYVVNRFHHELYDCISKDFSREDAQELIDKLDESFSKNEGDIKYDAYKNKYYALNSAVMRYNRQHDEKLQAPITKPCVKLFTEYGPLYRKENKEIDDYLKSEFEKNVKGMNQEELQDFVDDLSSKLKAEVPINTLKKIVSEYNMEYHTDILVSDIDKINSAVKALSKSLEYSEGKESHKVAINEFEDKLYKIMTDFNHNDAQRIINNFDKTLTDKYERDALNNVVRRHNQHSKEKYETSTIRLASKDRYNENSSYLSDKLNEFRDRLKDVIKNRERPVDKYDTGIMCSALRRFKELTSIAIEAFNCLSDAIDYHINSCKNKEELDEKIDSVSSPFYKVICEAYKEKGTELVNMLKDNEISKETAEILFLTDVAFIRTQDIMKQEELFYLYSESIIQGLKDKDIDALTKREIMDFIFKYERNEYEQDIKDYIEHGSPDIHKEKEENEQAKEQEQKQENNPEKPETADKQSVKTEEKKKEEKKEEKKDTVKKKQQEKKVEKSEQKKVHSKDKEQQKAAEAQSKNNPAPNQDFVTRFNAAKKESNEIIKETSKNSEEIPFEKYDEKDWLIRVDPTGKTKDSVRQDVLYLTDAFMKGKNAEAKLLDWSKDKKLFEIKQAVDYIDTKTSMDLDSSSRLFSAVEKLNLEGINSYDLRSYFTIEEQEKNKKYNEFDR